MRYIFPPTNTANFLTSILPVPGMASKQSIILSSNLVDGIHKFMSFKGLRHLLNFSLAPGKSPLCKQVIPIATHTPVGSRPHLVETSIANSNLSSSISLSLKRLKINRILGSCKQKSVIMKYQSV